ncbi:geranylgeranylglyceryl/heptaprenylglyceryl phosphate synthase [Oceanihabitans sediminis]|uniref:Geranylgeranylglyceryl phosphate synthase n=1 Tax=Oceanihabitans sediminis TaxID=1812012 RepID=A0A368P8X9_9FLAO|nr:geranylgeranylglyceryl/heptaprenylglyceryl phosphate synthase [Oceanihabitans sediminis]MDX1277594.1 geranylgeranylglyceryl/heptaprenylglyceryl phosphate synthase [Oceanihabitans sediminis]MDX1773231.1 geranylgeranylglyceryl/heptaprenylglyceryl phosphate synthase [Oceanihabitans sediminis]RBP34924.1 putative glycerol-1-phosphate prenyltransferase [Oceanihabitans sediminis]RCU58564.1 geranylgeranylglyceryl/heptaprenylglyceryl phosphate synthase [Oceanihabitans sediminis]
MKSIYNEILQAIAKEEKLLAVLIDPDNTKAESLASFMLKLNTSIATHIFVGGSTVEKGETEKLVKALKKLSDLPIVIFPGDISQITNHADALLFLSLISGRNPEYLIGKHVASISKLRNTNLEVIPTGYLLIENGKETAVQRVSGTEPLKRREVQVIKDTAKAGEFLGMKLIYLEAGSGATHPIESNIISEVKQQIQVPLIVGGGIRSKEALDAAYASGADMVVIGTAFEEDDTFFNKLKRD